jgi:transposase-like protein
MYKCPKCNSTNIVAIEYGYPSPEQYDGISEYQCQDCKYRQGRWSEKEIPEGYSESRFNKKGFVKIN